MVIVGPAIKIIYYNISTLKQLGNIMDLKKFTRDFMNFYKDGFIYLDTDSLQFDSEMNCLVGTLQAQIPAYRRNPVKDKILTNTESMFCVNQIGYATHFYYYYNHVGHDLQAYANQLLDSYLIVDMHFRYKSHIETHQPVPFNSIIRVDKIRHLDRCITTIKIGKNNNFIVVSKGYIVNKKMHET